ncbi:hypothetical protein B9Z19DRAFT_737129 [Tuber borchii]|uniref:Uncharacterized protein n=1 Tax=Tuber borchii TaxID=42251 RepID=A0A2T6ZXX4_TUBBO|nr:hypothetical protein B9Z19DRAFT_737129 [Tuber borchii]
MIPLPDLPFTWRCPIFFVSNFYSERQKKEEGGREDLIGGGKYDTVPKEQDGVGWGCCSPYYTAQLPPVLLLLHSGSLAPCCTSKFDISNGTRLITSGLKSIRVTKSVLRNRAYCRPLFLFISFSKPGGYCTSTAPYAVAPAAEILLLYTTEGERRYKWKIPPWRSKALCFFLWG